MQSTIYVDFFGDFSIRCEDVVLDNTVLTKQLCTLVSYLFLRKSTPPTHAEIAKALWPSGINDSRAALKNLVYRLKKISNQTGFLYWQNMIISYKNSYIINPELNYKIDIVSFDEDYKLSQQSSDIILKVQYLRFMIDAFQGNFLSNLPMRDWIKTSRDYYSEIYFKSVYELFELYRQTGDYISLYEVAKKATEINNYDEIAHQYIIHSLAKQGMQQKAIEHFNYISNMFYSDLGKSISAQTRKLYTEIAKSVNMSVSNISTLSLYLKEDDADKNNAFYCELEVFKQIYRLYSRNTKRNSRENYLLLFTLEGDTKEEKKALRERNMSNLYQTIRENLRQGDVFTRCSSSQYMVILSNINVENCNNVISRIKKRFKHAVINDGFKITGHLQEINDK